MEDLQLFFNSVPPSLKNKRHLAHLLSAANFGKGIALKVIKYLALNNFSWDDFWQNKRGVLEKICFNKNQYSSIKNYIKEQENFSRGSPSKLGSKQDHLALFFQTQKDFYLKILAVWEDDYPLSLKQIDDPPLLLFIKSKNKNYLEILQQSPKLAVVGTRHIDDYGRQVVAKLASQLAILNPTIVSGFMYGVDVAAHRAALNLHLNSIAVLGFGFDFLYPSSLHTFYDQSFNKGMVFLTEFPPKKPPISANFIKRNRLIAGLSSGVIIPQAALKSGSLITANYALNYGKEVFVVPGPIGNPVLAGVIALANQGATLIQDGQSIYKHLFFDCHYLDKQKNFLPDKQMSQILLFLAKKPASLDKIAEQLNSSSVKISSLVGQLEIAGLVKKTQTKWQLNNQEKIFSF